MAQERLQKILARAGVCSRRRAEELILAGRVTVNGRVIKKLGTKADAAKDFIKVDGKLIHGAPSKQYYMAYKPVKMLTTLADPRGRPTVADLLTMNKIRVRVFPVGRLDWDAEGLLLFTNDGELANKIMHPRSHLPKTYLVKVKGKPDEQVLRQIRTGVRIAPRTTTLPARVNIERRTRANTWLVLTLIEGRQNQIKRMFERLHHPVLRIKRTAIGPLKLKGLKPGGLRALSRREIEQLKSSLK